MEKLKNLALLALSVAVSLVILEGFLRLLAGSIPVAVMAEAPKMPARIAFLEARGFTVGAPVMVLPSSRGGRDIVLPESNTHKPVDPEDAAEGAVAMFHRTDGFCNEQPPLETGATLVGVGDSFTYCASVEIGESWAHVLGDLLQVRTANLGMPGEGLAQYYEALRQKAPPTTRIAVIGIYEGNDLRDALDFEAALKAGGEGPAPKRRLHVGRLIRSSFLGHSYLVAFVWGSIQTLEKRLGNPEFSYDVKIDGRWMTLNVHDQDSDEVRHARRVREGEITQARLVELWSEPISWIVDLAGDRGFAPLFIYIPSAYTAYDESVRFHDQDTGEAVKEMSKVQRAAFAEICESRGLNCLDTVGAFEAAGRERLTYFPSNVHLTPYGHRVVAEAIAGYISGAPQLARRLPGS